MSQEGSEWGWVWWVALGAGVACVLLLGAMWVQGHNGLIQQFSEAGHPRRPAPAPDAAAVADDAESPT